MDSRTLEADFRTLQMCPIHTDFKREVGAIVRVSPMPGKDSSIIPAKHLSIMRAKADGA